MFFKSKQKKIDSKIRFQQKGFTEKVRAAKSYKRTFQAVPETNQEKWLVGMGLDSWWSRGLVVIGILLLIYLVYIPNLLYTKIIHVAGVNDQQKNKVIEVTNNFFNDSTAFWPQQNILLLNKQKLEKYLIKNNQEILKVNKIKKGINSLSIEVEIKQPKFVLQTPKDSFILYNDGSVFQVMSDQQFSSPDLTIIKTNKLEQLEVKQNFLSEQIINAISLLQKGYSDEIKTPISYFEIPTLEKVKPLALTSEAEQAEVQNEFVVVPDELNVYSPIDLKVKDSRNFKAIFNTTSDINKSLTQLNALLVQMPQVQRNKLFYIDMRFSDRSFVCLVGTPCYSSPLMPDPTLEAVE